MSHHQVEYVKPSTAVPDIFNIKLIKSLCYKAYINIEDELSECFHVVVKEVRQGDVFRSLQ